MNVRDHGVAAGLGRRRRGAVVGDEEGAGDRRHAVGADRGGGVGVGVAVVGGRAVHERQGRRQRAGAVDDQVAGHGRRGVVGIVAGERRDDGVKAGAGRRRGVAVVGELEAAIDGGDAVNADGRRGRRVRACRRN